MSKMQRDPKTLIPNNDSLYKANLKDMLIKDPKGLSISFRFSLIYCCVAVITILILLLAGQTFLAILSLAIAFSFFVLLDMLISLKNTPPTRRGKKFHAVITCGFTTIALLFCLFQLFNLLI